MSGSCVLIGGNEVPCLFVSPTATTRFFFFFFFNDPAPTEIYTLPLHDALPILGVQFKLDGVTLGVEVTATPYSMVWDATLVAPGAHSVSAVARDAAGHTATAGVSVTVADTAPPAVALTAPAPGASVSGTVTVSATATDNVGVVGVQFKLDGVNLGAEDTTNAYSLSWTTTSVPNGTHTLTAVARDASGHAATPAAVSVTVANDLTPPSVSLTEPADGAIVSDTVTVSATASDNVGVARVQFKLDGVNLGAELTAAPYAVSWPTTSASNGVHTLMAMVWDAAGDAATAAA